MMYGRGKSSPVIVAGKPANNADPDSVSAAESVERRAGAKGNADQRPRTGLSAGHAWYWCWRAYIKLQSLIVSTRGGNRMRESCEYGSVRGREVTRVPTASGGASSSRCSVARQRGRSRRTRSRATAYGASACSCRAWLRQLRSHAGEQMA